ncbi:HAD-IA family hydrolase [Halopseudomonas salegens]|uniref:Phosphoglycolate phosphatase n=1 Tax=Halopseudomonas salegens TaxID=1434072 RepID=A0A1H2G604_9GAMM|nr:HAD-IA family hydrolase [Halopseudomonas salegens]SDU14961.1 phosphoglycolate phosphatase [Halopseudomonas salegens]
MRRGVLFDLDGTLLDTVEDFYRIIEQMRSERAAPEVPAQVIRQQVSNGSVGMLCAAFAIRPDAADFTALRDDFLQRYEQQLAVHTRPFPGITELLDWLDEEQIPWGVVTNKLSRFSIPLLAAMGWSERCAALVCPDQVSQPKPHPEPLFKACEQMAVDPVGSLFVGDHLRDIDAGRAAGMQTVAALYGYLPVGDDPGRWQADHCITHAVELRPWLTRQWQPEKCHV